MRSSGAAGTVLLVTVLVCFASATPAEASHPLEGFGATTPGGAGWPVYRVTTLSDSGSGSLRAALAGGHRRVVFDVAGEILLESPIRVWGPYITVAGLTAPPPGVTLRNHGLILWGSDGVHDVIVESLRIRNANGDGVQIAWGAHRVVLDHISVDGSADGNVDITHGAHDVTVQWSILGRTRLGKNTLIKTMVRDAPAETNRVSVHHTLLVESAFRNPRISHFADGSTWATDVTADLRNNIIANWDSGVGTDVECGAWANVIGNLYSSPASSLSDQAQAVIVRANGQADCLLGGLAYVASNVSATALAVDINTNPDYVKTPAATPFPAAPVTTQATCDAAVRVEQEAGVRQLDTVDRDLLSRLSLGVCGTRPDLVPVAASGPAAVRPNTKFKVKDTVVNRGDAATGPFIVGIFMSPDSVVNGGDVLLAQRRVDKGLAAGAKSAATTRVTITKLGTWWLGVCADWEGAVAEAAESNNCLTIGKIVVK